MIKAFYYSKAWAIWAYGGLSLLILSLWLQVQFTVAFNSWYGRFYRTHDEKPRKEWIPGQEGIL